MGDPAPPAEVGPWAAEKLDALEAYLHYYSKVLKNQSWIGKKIYLDAFAGGGHARLRPARPDANSPLALWEEVPAPEQDLVIRGSPRRALELADPFDRYVFIDADPRRVAELRALKTGYGRSRNIYIREGDATAEIDWLLGQRLTKKDRGVAFLDPFGAHLPWASIAALAATGIFEVIINLPLHMAMNRLMTIDGQIPPTWRTQLDTALGSEWFEEVYFTKAGLFDEQICKREDAIPRVLALYRAKLKSAFGHVSQPRLIRNTRQSPLYFLLWAGPHKKGLEGANHVLKLGERLSHTKR